MEKIELCRVSKSFGPEGDLPDGLERGLGEVRVLVNHQSVAAYIFVALRRWPPSRPKSGIVVSAGVNHLAAPLARSIRATRAQL